MEEDHVSFCTVYHVIFKMNGNSFSEKGLCAEAVLRITSHSLRQ